MTHSNGLEKNQGHRRVWAWNIPERTDKESMEQKQTPQTEKGTVESGSAKAPGTPKGPKRRKKRKGIRPSTIGIILLFLAGLGILLYPTISNLYNTHRSEKLITVYNAVVQDGDVDVDAEWKKAKEYNSKLSPRSVPDAFAAKAGKRSPEYEKLLNVTGDGMMGYVDIPSIDVNLPIYHYTTTKVLKEGAGHLLGSSLPVGGKGTHSVISAHRGLPSAKMFTDLDQLKKGDTFTLTVLNQVLTYEIDQILIVLPDEMEALAIEEGEDYCTLVTCTPYGVNTHRLLVRGHRVETEDTTKITVTGDAFVLESSVIAPLVAVPVLLLLLLVLMVSTRRRKH